MVEWIILVLLGRILCSWDELKTYLPIIGTRKKTIIERSLICLITLRPIREKHLFCFALPSLLVLVRVPGSVSALLCRVALQRKPGISS
jgi:hypothetical protein